MSRLIIVLIILIGAAGAKADVTNADIEVVIAEQVQTALTISQQVNHLTLTDEGL